MSLKMTYTCIYLNFKNYGLYRKKIYAKMWRFFDY